MGKKNKNNAATQPARKNKIGWKRKLTKEEKALQIFIAQDRVQFPGNVDDVMLALLTKPGMAMTLLEVGKRALKTNAIHAGVLHSMKTSVLPERYFTAIYEYDITSKLDKGTLDGFADAFGLTRTAEMFGNKEGADNPPCPYYHFTYLLFSWFGLSDPASIVPIWAEAATVYVLTNGNYKASVNYIAMAAIDTARRERIAYNMMIEDRIMAAVELSIKGNCGE